MDLRLQKRLAAEVLKCGKDRVWMDPTAMEDIGDAVTRSDIRSLINSKWIKKKPRKGISSARKKHRKAQKKKGKRKGVGKRKGKKGARMPRKEKWMKTIRALRSQLRELRDQGEIDSSVYRHYYRQAKGGMFRSRAHLLAHMEADGVLRKEKKVKDESRKRVRKVRRRRIIGEDR